MSNSSGKRFDINEAISHLQKVDPILSTIISDKPDYRVYRKRNSFESLVRIIVGQQLSSKAARTIYNRLKTSVIENRITAQSLSYLDEGDFTSAGISRMKTRTIRILVNEVISGRLVLEQFVEMDDVSISNKLTRIKGIGPWTIQMYLMFVLCRPDIFPEKDTGIKNAIRKIYANGSHQVDFKTISDRWRPFRTVACMFLWKYIDKTVTR
ncbi:MAG: DNA-3-methyladenine glycosylase 2 family protein [Sedimentisphaerales bacterium]|nr:DNA-3-methyladenine glycosylase 2 family protein [Sedimentisphaerales bacterium]